MHTLNLRDLRNAVADLLALAEAIEREIRALVESRSDMDELVEVTVGCNGRM